MANRLSSPRAASATACGAGAGKWRASYNPAVHRPASLVIVPDRDVASRCHAARVRAICGASPPRSGCWSWSVCPIRARAGLDCRPRLGGGCESGRDHPRRAGGAAAGGGWCRAPTQRGAPAATSTAGASRSRTHAEPATARKSARPLIALGYCAIRSSPLASPVLPRFITVGDCVSYLIDSMEPTIGIEPMTC